MKNHWKEQKNYLDRANLPLGARAFLKDIEKIDEKLAMVDSNFDMYFDSVRRSYTLAKEMNLKMHDCVETIMDKEFALDLGKLILILAIIAGEQAIPILGDVITIAQNRAKSHMPVTRYEEVTRWKN